jgi:hypothetical protein
LGGTEKIFDIMIFLKGITNPEDGPFFATILEIAAENLENAEAFQHLKFIPKGEGGKSQQRKDIVVHSLPVR